MTILINNNNNNNDNDDDYYYHMTFKEICRSVMEYLSSLYCLMSQSFFPPLSLQVFLLTQNEVADIC